MISTAISRNFDLKIALLHLLVCQLALCPAKSHANSFGDLNTAETGHENHFDLSNHENQRGKQRYQAFDGEKSAEHRYKQNELDKASLNKGNHGHSSHQHESVNNQADKFVNHVGSSSKEGKERVVKHEWDRGGGYVKQWNWDKGVHYEKESNDAEKKKTIHHQHDRERESREKGKGQSGYHQHHQQNHEKKKSQQGYGQDDQRQSNEAGHRQNHHRNRHRGSNGDYPIRTDGSEPVSEYSRRRFADLQELIRTKYMPILHRYGRKNSRYAVDRVGPLNSIPSSDSRETLSRNRWKLGHLLGNGLDAVLPSLHESKFRARISR